MRVGERRLVSVTRLDAVLGLDLVAKRTRIAVDDGLERPRLRLEPPPARARVQLLEVREQALGLAYELRAAACARLQLGPREDETFRVLARREGELDVTLSEIQRSNRAACPWPTPTQSVASP